MCNKRHYFKHSARLKHTSKLTISSKTCHIHAEYCKPTLLAGALHSVTQNVIVTGVSTSATSDYCYHFYRAMHFSAKRGVAIARRLSVRLSLCPSATLVDCDHIGWNSSEIISPLVNLWCSLSADPNNRGLHQGEHQEILVQSDPPPVDLSVVDIWSQIAAEWWQIAQRSQWRGYRKPPSLFRMVPLLTTYDLPFPPKWGSICTKDTRMAISPQRVIQYTSCLVLG